MFLVQMAAAAAIESELHVTIRLRNYANVPRATLMESEREATLIFQEAGISTDWHECRVPPGHSDFSCEAPIGSAELSIEVVSSQTMRIRGLQHETLGVAILPAELADAFATQAFVCASCVKDLVMAQGRDLETKELKSAILGSVIAHELGHLLGVRDHAAVGVMHMPWNKQELTMAQQGRLLFTSDEKRAIQAQVRMRQIAECAPRASRELLTSSLGQ